MIHAYITGVAPAAPPPAYYLAPLTGLAAVEIWGWRGSVGTVGKAGILGILGKAGKLRIFVADKGCLVPTNT